MSQQAHKGLSARQLCVCRMSLLHQRCIRPLNATATLSAFLSLRPDTCNAPGCKACNITSQWLYPDKAFSTATLPRALQPISGLPAMYTGQIWPHVSVVLSHIGQDRLPGLLQQHKPKWMAEVKLHSFCLGEQPPSITSAKVEASSHVPLCEVEGTLGSSPGTSIATGVMLA